MKILREILLQGAFQRLTGNRSTVNVAPLKERAGKALLSPLSRCVVKMKGKPTMTKIALFALIAQLAGAVVLAYSPAAHDAFCQAVQ